MSEAPTLKLIKPCKCSGSAAYVHLNCLNKWRETSRKANQHCSVCNYGYVVKKSEISELLLSERTVLVCAIIVYLSSVVFLGIVLQYVLRLVSNVDIVDLTLFHMDLGLRWRYFRLSAADRSELIRSLYDRFEFIAIYDLLLCNETAYDIMNTLIVGQLALCVIGAVHSVTADLIVILREGRRVPTTQSLFLFAAVAVNKVFALRVWVPVHGQYVSSKVPHVLKRSNLNSYNRFCAHHSFTATLVAFNFYVCLACRLVCITCGYLLSFPLVPSPLFSSHLL
jgi:positive regulator of sigma E activity